MKHLKYILGLFGVLLGWLFVERSRRQSAEALNKNTETKEEVQKLEGEKLKNDAQLKLEEERRNDAHEKANDEKSKPATDAELLDFFRKLK